MGNWTSDVKLAPIEFDGDAITFHVKRLLIEDMSDMMKNFNPETQKLSFGAPSEVCELAARIIPKYVTRMAGMNKGDGTAFTIEEFMAVSNEFYFVPLIGQLFGELVSASVVGKSDEKNSVPPSAGSSAE